MEPGSLTSRHSPLIYLFSFWSRRRAHQPFPLFCGFSPLTHRLLFSSLIHSAHRRLGPDCASGAPSPSGGRLQLHAQFIIVRCVLYCTVLSHACSPQTYLPAYTGTCGCVRPTCICMHHPYSTHTPARLWMLDIIICTSHPVQLTLFIGFACPPPERPNPVESSSSASSPSIAPASRLPSLSDSLLLIGSPVPRNTEGSAWASGPSVGETSLATPRGESDTGYSSSRPRPFPPSRRFHRHNLHSSTICSQIPELTFISCPTPSQLTSRGLPKISFWTGYPPPYQYPTETANVRTTKNSTPTILFFAPSFASLSTTRSTVRQSIEREPQRLGFTPLSGPEHDFTKRLLIRGALDAPPSLD